MFQLLFSRGLQRIAPAATNEHKANLAVQFVRASAVEMHLDISEEAVYARISNENTADQDLDNSAVQTLCDLHS